jgi:two-component system, OmpR family, sensor kinase
LRLRSRLVAIVLLLTAAGLLASAIATPRLLRSYLMRRVDDRLEITGSITARAFTGGFVVPQRPLQVPPPGIDRPTRTTPDVQAALIGPDGNVVRTLQGPFSSNTDAFSHISSTVLASARSGRTVKFNITSHSGHWRALAEPVQGTNNVAVVVSPLSDVEATLTHLYWIEGIAFAVLLALAGGAALWLVRVGLRPLVHIADTADAVAAGEVDRRVDVTGGYEVARLGHALNSAFDAQATSEEALRAFISDASHELRTPLTSIRGYAELLRAGALRDQESQQRALERIEHEAARMGVLVDDLLALARLDERRPLQLETLDLTTLAADAVNDFRAVEPDRPVSLVASAPVPIVGDETGIRQVFANLLTNARVHTDAGTPVEVRVGATPTGARIDVIDDGVGLDAAQCEHAFDRFWRAGNGKQGHDEGSGLGLAIVAAFAAAHGGTAQARRAEGSLGGAQFTVFLPARPPA